MPTKPPTTGSELGARPSELPAAACSATTSTGHPCRFPPRHGADLCINHDPSYRDEQQSNRLAGTHAATLARQAHARRRTTTIATDLDHYTLADRASIQAAIETFFRLELAGRLPNNRARHLVRALGLALRNLETQSGHLPSPAKSGEGPGVRADPPVAPPVSNGHFHEVTKRAPHEKRNRHQ